VLIALLENAKEAACCDDIRDARKHLNDFINKVNFYIKKDYISKELGCYLVKIACRIIDELRCCNTCNCDETHEDGN
jgi:hypothetical protein